MTKRKNKRGRNVNGILLLDKPSGITSNDALQMLKRIFNARKAGHTGSLDKPATGLLPICFGEATKFTSYLLNADKHYIARCQLGIETTTGDAAGKITKTKKIPKLTIKQMSQLLSRYQGDIDQVPPMHSALKHKGQRLYKLAYQGIEVERQSRPVYIYSIKLLELNKDQMDIEVHCSKGTYIRTLVEDIGKDIGCGAHLLNLVRTGVGRFSQDEMINMETITELADKGQSNLDSTLLPIDSIITEMPKVTLMNSVSCYLEKGQAVIVPHAPTDGMLRIYNENQDFLGVAEVLEDGRIAPRRLVNLSSG